MEVTVKLRTFQRLRLITEDLYEHTDERIANKQINWPGMQVARVTMQLLFPLIIGLLLFAGIICFQLFTADTIDIFVFIDDDSSAAFVVLSAIFVAFAFFGTTLYEEHAIHVVTSLFNDQYAVLYTRINAYLGFQHLAPPPRMFKAPRHLSWSSVAIGWLNLIAASLGTLAIVAKHHFYRTQLAIGTISVLCISSLFIVLRGFYEWFAPDKARYKNEADFRREAFKRLEIARNAIDKICFVLENKSGFVDKMHIGVLEEPNCEGEGLTLIASLCSFKSSSVPVVRQPEYRNDDWPLVFHSDDKVYWYFPGGTGGKYGRLNCGLCLSEMDYSVVVASRKMSPLASSFVSTFQMAFPCEQRVAVVSQDEIFCPEVACWDRSHKSEVMQLSFERLQHLSRRASRQSTPWRDGFPTESWRDEMTFLSHLELQAFVKKKRPQKKYGAIN